MRHNVIETIMGTVVLGTAAFFLTFAYSNSRYRGGHDDRVYQATFDRVDGLVVGSDVRLSGVKVGTVQFLKIDPTTFLAQMRLAVSAELKLPEDTSAEIVSDGLMGGKYLALVPGGAENLLKENDFIVHTQSSVSLESMIGQLIFSSKGSKNTEKATKNSSVNSLSTAPTPVH